jgi:hypothetical protein
LRVGILAPGNAGGKPRAGCGNPAPVAQRTWRAHDR